MMAHLHLTKEMQNKQQPQQQQQHQGVGNNNNNNNNTSNDAEKNNSNSMEKHAADDRNDRHHPLSPPLASLAMAFNERTKVRSTSGNVIF